MKVSHKFASPIQRYIVMLILQYVSHYISFCYVHPEGVAEPGLTIKFQERRIHKQEYEIVKVSSA